MAVFDYLRKCHFRDVTVGGGLVVSTSGFLFLVGHDLNRSTCSGEFFLAKFVRTRICTFFDLFGPCSRRRRGRSGSHIQFQFSVFGRASAIFLESVCLAVAELQLPVGQTVEKCEEKF